MTGLVNIMKTLLIRTEMVMEDIRWEMTFWVDGSGVDFKLGFILRPFESSSFRIGAAVHTPTFFSLKERNTAYINFDLNETTRGITKPYDARGNDTEGEYEYKLITPWKFNASMGYTIGSSVALGVEYEYSDRTSAKMKDPDGYELGSDRRH